MGLGIDGETMDSVLDAKVFQFAVVVRIILMENGNGAAVTCDINTTKARIKLDHIGSIGDRQKGDRSVLVQIKDCHQFVLFTREESTMMLRINGHSVIALAPPDGISTDSFVS
jgi:hypothetical protein